MIGVRRWWPVLAVLGLAACHPHRPQAAPRPAADPQVQLAQARRLFHRGSFTKALQAFQRLTFELQAGDPAVAEVHYNLAECYFQTGLLRGTFVTGNLRATLEAQKTRYLLLGNPYDRTGQIKIKP